MRNSRKARIIRRRLRFGPTIGRFLALIILTILAVIMLTNSTGNATKLYEKSTISKKKADLAEEVKELEFWVERQQTLKSITSGDLVNQLEPINDPDHIEGEVAGQSAENKPQ